MDIISAGGVRSKTAPAGLGLGFKDFRFAHLSLYCGLALEGVRLTWQVVGPRKGAGAVPSL